MRYSCTVKSLLALSHSVKVAVALILLITTLSLLSTLVGFHHFFRSAFFLAPVLLFSINLGSCAAYRFIRRLREAENHRFGPDLVHLGLLVLIAEGLLSALGRQEQTLTAGAGDTVQLSSTLSLRLLSLDMQSYENGAPKDWISTVKVTRGTVEQVPSYPIRVNHPLRLGGLSVYQSSWGTEGTLDAADPGGRPVRATTGQGFEEGGTTWLFAAVEKAGDGLAAVFQQVRGRQIIAVKRVSAGQVIGPFRVERVSARDVTGLTAVSDPGFPVVIAALILVSGGLALALVQGWKGGGK